MVDRERAGEILGEIVNMVRVFRISGQGERTISGTKMGVLRHLKYCDARLGELAANLSVSASVASRVVDSLEHTGLVERGTDAEDARACVISITEQGRENLAERERYVAEVFAGALSEWSHDETQQAVDILHKLNGHLNELVETLETNDGSVPTA